MVRGFLSRLPLWLNGLGPYRKLFAQNALAMMGFSPDSLLMKTLFYAILSVLITCASARADVVTVFAASSLKDAMDSLSKDWAEASGHQTRMVYGASSAMARQIDQGAPADVFMSANLNWVTWLTERDVLVGDPSDIASNRLVLVGAKDAAPIALTSGAMAEALNGGRLAIALPSAVPAGIYAQQALTSLGLWEDVAPHLAQTPHVRAALALVARQETPLGIVYQTDAVAESRVTIVAEFPPTSHQSIRYVAASVSDTPVSKNFLTWLQTSAAQDRLKQFGFQPPEAAHE